MPKKPIIGITCDTQESGEYSKFPWYGLRQNYCSAVSTLGGIPFPLIHDLNLIEPYLSQIEGLLITGGGHDINPTLYGSKEVHSSVTLKPKRTAFELAITKLALEQNFPILGICGGEQLLNVAFGGSLIQHIPDEVPEYLEHQIDPRTKLVHTVKIFKESLLYKILRTEEIPVNSGHHQAIKQPGLGLKVNALAPDGVIEGIEAPSHSFCLGLQWHPEFLITPYDRTILKAFIEAAYE